MLFLLFLPFIVLSMESYIKLKEMQFYAYHGVMEQERLIGNYFTVDLILKADISKAASSDHLEDTLNYASVFQLVKEEMHISSNLLEHVAGRIISRLKKEFPAIEKIKLSIAKQRPPVGGDVKEAVITLVV